MATVTNKLTPAQVAAACALYVRRLDAGKNVPVPDESIFLTTFNAHFMKGEAAVEAFDYVIVTYDV